MLTYRALIEVPRCFELGICFVWECLGDTISGLLLNYLQPFHLRRK